MTPAGLTSAFHNGVDIGPAWGTPVICPAPGRVAFSGVDSVGAHIVTVRFEDGTGALFVHLDGPQAGYGKQLARGETLGYVGNTGMSSGPHLHYMRTRHVVDAQAFWYADEDIFDPFSPEGGHVENPAIVSPVNINRVAGTWPQYSGSGAYLAVVADATPNQVIAEAQAEAGVALTSIWMLLGGLWRGYTVGAPAAVNASFPALIPANSAIYVRRA